MPATSTRNVTATAAPSSSTPTGSTTPLRSTPSSPQPKPRTPTWSSVPDSQARGDYKVRGPRQWAMKLLSVILSQVCGTRLTDTTSGFKLANRRTIHLFAHDYPAEYLGDTIEALVIAKRSGLRIRQAAVVMRPRAGGSPSHSPIKAARFLIRAFLALGVALTRPSSQFQTTEVREVQG